MLAIVDQSLWPAYSAIVATVAAVGTVIWNVHLWHRDRADVRVTVGQTALELIDGGNLVIDGLALIHTVNRGRRPIELVTFEVLHAWKAWKPIRLPGLPFELKAEGQSEYHWIRPISELQEMLNEDVNGRLIAARFGSRDGRRFTWRVGRWSEAHDLLREPYVELPTMGAFLGMLRDWGAKAYVKPLYRGRGNWFGRGIRGARSRFTRASPLIIRREGPEGDYLAANRPLRRGVLGSDS